MAKPFDVSKFRKDITKSVNDTGWQDPEDDEPVVATAPVTAPAEETSKKTADILAMIRQRKSVE